VALTKSDDPLLEEAGPSRFVVGIDLGTTNSAAMYVDTDESPWRVRVFAVPQLVDAGQVEARETLPSFHYQAAEGEFADGALRLPWSREKESPRHAVGVFARDHGTQTPGRLIASAKSWLCHAGVDRMADLLPWHAAADVERISPVEASSRYLRHVHDAWNARFKGEPLSEQDIVLTLPASFDEVARELTVEAAARAGLKRVVLIEEPQAAFYAWIDAHAESWQQHVEPGQKILVCDIGGGTSDFTLIRVRQLEQPGEKGGQAPSSDSASTPDSGGQSNAGLTSDDDGPGASPPFSRVQFHRVAVGDHLILGGDNLDLALAKHLEEKLGGRDKLEPRQWDVLVRSCRRVKEELLGPKPPERTTVNLPRSGSRLIGGGVQVEATRDEVRDRLLDGFFPRVALDDKPQRRQSGFQEFGLPYAADPAVTRYLAAFLTAHRFAGEEVRVSAGHVGTESQPTEYDPARPDIVLFNGGVFESTAIRERLLEVITSWFQQEGEQPWRPKVLDNVRLDLAVARGAAYYGMVRRGEGVRIAAGLARSYYIGVESDPPAAVCLVPGSTEPGHDIDLPERRFELRISEPVEFPLFISSTRLADRPGELVEIDREQMRPLPPIRTVLRTQRRSERGTVSVELHARLTEIGTLDLWCSQVESDRRWRLQFDVRSATQTDIAAHQSAAEAEGVIDEATWQACEERIQATFAGDQKSAECGKSASAKPESLVKSLIKATGVDRREWPTSLLRRIWETLMDVEPGRRKSVVHEARWLNLLGYALRPGYGLAVDDWRVTETWRHVQGKLAHGAAVCRNESYILWRRIAGGLSSGQQRAVAEPLLTNVRALHRRLVGGKAKSGDPPIELQDTAEMWRLLGSLELLPVNVKVQLGDVLVELLPKKKIEPVRGALVWALGRLGQRVPVYGPLNTIVAADVAERWLRGLLALDRTEAFDKLAVMQLARGTDDRRRDVSQRLREELVAWLSEHEAPVHYLELVRVGGQLDAEEQGQVFGESLPKGLRIA
jgi:molecular chaperone DnaK (HSP70)